MLGFAGSVARYCSSGLGIIEWVPSPRLGRISGSGGKLCALKLEDTAGVARHSLIAETTSVARIEKSSVSNPPASVPASAANTK